MCAAALSRLLRLWPPFLCSSIRVQRISDDHGFRRGRRVRKQLDLRLKPARR